MKYKVGDKAIITSNTSDHEFKIGEKVTITELNPENKDYIAEGNEDWWYVNDGELTDVKVCIKITCPHCKKDFDLNNQR